MKLLLLLILCSFLGFAKGEIFAKFPPGTNQCFLWDRYLAAGETYRPFAQDEHDECFEAFCGRDESDGLVLQGRTCPSTEGYEGCRFHVESGSYPKCCPKVECNLDLNKESQ